MEQSFPVAGTERVAVNGTDLAYLERGAGDSVVFVHGTSQDLRTWLHQLDAFAARYRTIIYSRRYARPNDDIPPGQDDQMQPHVDDLIALLVSLDAQPAHLVGSSWGGFICLLAALHAPEKVRTLVLCEPPVLPLFISNQPKAAELLRLLVRRPADALRVARFGIGVVEPTAKAYRSGDTEKAQAIFGAGLLGEASLAALSPETRRMLEENQSVEIAQMLGAGFPPISAEQVRSIRIPTLVVTGDRSAPVLRKTVANELVRLLPNAERAVIPEASHLMHEENPLRFNEVALAFLQRRSP